MIDENDSDDNDTRQSESSRHFNLNAVPSQGISGAAGVTGVRGQDGKQAMKFVSLPFRGKGSNELRIGESKAKGKGKK